MQQWLRFRSLLITPNGRSRMGEKQRNSVGNGGDITSLFIYYISPIRWQRTGALCCVNSSISENISKKLTFSEQRHAFITKKLRDRCPKQHCSSILFFCPFKSTIIFECTLMGNNTEKFLTIIFFPSLPKHTVL